MFCANTLCNKRKPEGLVGRLLTARQGFIRENKWFCSERCYSHVVLDQFYRSKTEGSDLHSSTFPVTARALGSALLRMGKLDWFQLEEAMEARRSSGAPLAHFLLANGVVSRRDILEALGRHHKVPVVTVGAKALDPAIVAMLPPLLARLGGAVPLSYDQAANRVSLIMRDPTDLTTLLAVRRLLGCSVQVFQGDPAEVRRLIGRYYSEQAEAGEIPTPAEGVAQQQLAAVH